MTVIDDCPELGARAPTLRDVALRAGVSTQTVSRVVNDQPMVHRDTRRAVLAAIGELRYRPNRAARALVTRHSQLIGVVLPQIEDINHGACLLAIDLAAQKYGYALIIRHISTEAPALTRGQLNLLVDIGVEGLIVASAAKSLIDAINHLATPTRVVYLDPVSDVDGENRALSAHHAVTALLPPTSRTPEIFSPVRQFL